MQKLREILRVLRDLAIVAIAGLVVWKVAVGDGTSVREAPATNRVERLPRLTNSLGMTLVRLPGGEFLMGSDSYSRETAVHRVRITKAFWIGQHEVTQAEYEPVLRTQPSGFRGATLPVEQVSWTEAVEFCRRLSAQEQRTYRLPTEAEWEYACRAGSRRTFCHGDDDTRLGEFAWYDASAGRKTHPVGSRKPNNWGLHDLHGNVWEWCADGYQEDYYRESPADDPKAPESGPLRVLRGGSWSNRPVFCRSARRDFNRLDYRDNGVGFRVVLEVEP